MKRPSKHLLASLVLLFAALVTFVAACGSSSGKSVAGLEPLLADLESKGFTIAEITIVSDPAPAAQLTVVASDAYSATELKSRLVHEVSASKARGHYPYDSVNVKVVDSRGAVLAHEGEAIIALPATTTVTRAGDADAAQIVRDYLVAANAGRRLPGLTVSSVAATTADGERTLHVVVSSSEEGRVSGGLDWLIIGATSEHGWVGDLNRQGLGLSWVEIRVTYVSGLPDSLSIVDVARRSVSTYAGGRAPDFGPRPYTTSASATRGSGS